MSTVISWDSESSSMEALKLYGMVTRRTIKDVPRIDHLPQCSKSGSLKGS